MLIQIDVVGDIAILSLNRPEKRNSLSREVVEAFLGALVLPAVKTARALVIESQGPVFCAGADIGDLLTGDWMDEQGSTSSPVSLFRALMEYPRPVVAAVQGPALGGGFELVLSCDLAVVSDTASFAFPEAGYGVIPNTGLALLVPIVGRKRAFELMLTRRRIDAQEALALGLVNAVAPGTAVHDTAVGLARKVVDGVAPGAITETKRSLERQFGVDWAEVNASLSRLPPAQWQEGLRAFIERRTPNYDSFWRNQ